MTESYLQLLLIMVESMPMKVCLRRFMKIFLKLKAKVNIFTKTSIIDTIIRELSKKVYQNYLQKLKNML